ncbi:AAA family ATPase [Saccharopolyspora griseoalba]|uniref:AAA family ATPase n=1 Tax=Saccharopolyspora griseoalba TaxID=1431848 RepID=A0ABW2LTH7_9PSEU
MSTSLAAPNTTPSAQPGTRPLESPALNGTIPVSERELGHAREHVDVAPPPCLRLPYGRCLVVLAGVPGAGKTTLLHQVTADVPTICLDSEQVTDRLRTYLPRVRYPRLRPLVHLLHFGRIVTHSLSGRASVLAHAPATSRAKRLALLGIATITGRTPVLVWLHATPEDALRGQHDRGRTLPASSFRRHSHRGRRITRRLQQGQPPRGWTAHLLTRGQVTRGLHLTTT